MNGVVNLPAPKVTPEYIKSRISHWEYHTFAGRLTLCIIHMKNGALITGESACVDIRNFDKDIGERIAYDNAFDKLWMLEGYALMERLALGSNSF